MSFADFEHVYTTRIGRKEQKNYRHMSSGLKEQWQKEIKKKTTNNECVSAMAKTHKLCECHETVNGKRTVTSGKRAPKTLNSITTFAPKFIHNIALIVSYLLFTPKVNTHAHAHTRARARAGRRTMKKWMRLNRLLTNVITAASYCCVSYITKDLATMTPH